MEQPNVSSNVVTSDVESILKNVSCIEDDEVEMTQEEHKYIVFIDLYMKVKVL